MPAPLIVINDISGGKQTMILTNDFVQKYDDVEMICENKEHWKYNAPHTFLLVGNYEGEKDVAEVKSSMYFQEGPVKEVDINGFSNEQVILAVLTRLEAFQNSPYKCKENEDAIFHLNEALEAMYSRTCNREKRNVEGTSEI